MTERRTRLLLVGLIVAQLLLLSAQVPTADGSSTLLAGGLLRVVAPLGNAVDAVADGVGRVAVSWTTRRRLLAENERLRVANEKLQQEVVRRFGIEGEVERLAEAIDYERSSDIDLRVADVVYLDRQSWLKALWLRVTAGEVAVNQPVVTAAGLLGRVISTSGPYAKVQLITDRAASVGVMVERTRRQGIVRGGSGGLALEFIPLQADLRIGDRVVTAGIDGVYPRGIPVGTVTRAEPGSELFYEVDLSPAANFDAIDHAYILELETLLDSADVGAPDGSL